MLSPSAVVLLQHAALKEHAIIANRFGSSCARHTVCMNTVHIDNTNHAYYLSSMTLVAYQEHKVQTLAEA